MMSEGKTTCKKELTCSESFGLCPHRSWGASPISPKYYITLEGNIGAGKSTVLNSLPATYHKIREPIELYSNFKKHNPLKLGYENPKENAMATQVCILQASPAYYCEKLASSVCQLNISERSVHSPPPFIEARYLMGEYGAFSRDVLMQMWDSKISLLKGRRLVPNHTIYLSVRPEVCAKRLIERGEKFPISPRYLSFLHDSLEKFYRGRSSVTTIQIDAEFDKEAVKNLVQAEIERLWMVYANSAVLLEE